MQPGPRTLKLAPEMDSRKGHIHVVGVAGVGMSALAGALLGAGYEVSGSDRYLDQGEALDVLDRLAAAGVRLCPQDGSGVRADTTAVAVSTAIEDDNADLGAAARWAVPVVHRAALLARLAERHRVVAIAGTSGKTTVAGLTGWLMEQGGWEPTVVNGGVVLDWRRADRVGNYRAGSSPWMVLETDESDKSLLHFAPEYAAITNISKDHFELAEVQALFRQFAARVTGPLLGGRGVASMLGPPAEEASGEVFARNGQWSFRYAGLEWPSPMLGRHNAENAALAVALGHRLGLSLESMRQALPRFRGIHRRLEVVGQAGGVRIIDDYAHNPAKIAASWRAVSETSPRVLGFWRPHGFGPLALMKDELAQALAGVCRAEDRVFVLPVYYAGGTASRHYTAEEFAALLGARGVPASLAADYEDLLRQLRARTRPGDTILGMGARDPALPLFARRLAEGGLVA